MTTVNFRSEFVFHGEGGFVATPVAADVAERSGG
jgi:hypothetical protein